jgi:hypothetical protein
MKFVHAIRRIAILIGITLFLLLSFGLMRPTPALAKPASQQVQKEILLNRFQVDIWPEYDKPSVLVIYHITLSTQTSLPTTMSIPIPAVAGKPYAVAWQSTDKALYDLKYEMVPAGDWTEIQFSTPAPDVQIEYYDPSLKKTGARRDFTFRWSGKYAVQDLSLTVQQPVNATDMTFRPAAGSGHPGDYGLTYYSLVVGKVNAGTTFDLAISYNKPDETLTNPDQFQKAQPNQPVDSSTSGRVAFDQLLPWGVGGLGLLLIAAGSFWYWRTGRVPSARTAAGRPHHTHSRSGQVLSPAAVGETTYCHQCGKKAAPGDAFCRACGTKLR